MPKVKKVSFGDFGAQTPGNSQHGSVAGGSQRGAKSYWDHLQKTDTPPDVRAQAANTSEANARKSTDLGVPEMRDLMRKLNFSKSVPYHIDVLTPSMSKLQV